MIVTVLIIMLSLVILMALHELGHFALAKLFKIKVDEFGIGYPPRIFNKKIGETVYSLNLLPIGAFVKIPGREEGVNDPRSFSQKPVWQRILVVLGGVISFWVIAATILSFLAGFKGMPTAVPDDYDLKGGGSVQIFSVAPNSPAEKAGMKVGDRIIMVKSQNSKIKKIDKVGEVQEFVQENLGKEITLSLQRGERVFDVSLSPRLSPPRDEGAIGVGLARVAEIKTAWHKAPWVGIKLTAQQTKAMPMNLFDALKKKMGGEKVAEIQLRGVVGIGQMMWQSLGMGVGYFLTLVAMLSIGMALFNILPIPALDGGWLLFLIIEGVRKKPLPLKIEQGITAVFFSLLIFLMVIVTMKDIVRLF